MNISVTKAYDVKLRKKRNGNSGTKSKFSSFVYADIYPIFQLQLFIILFINNWPIPAFAVRYQTVFPFSLKKNVDN